MGLKIRKVKVWSGQILDSPGGLARTLEAQIGRAHV